MGRGRPQRPLSEIEQFCLCGWIMTGDSVTAYTLSHNTQSDSRDNLIKMASRWLNRKESKEYIENRRRADFKALRQPDKGIVADEVKNLTREDAERELNAILLTNTDPKTRAQVIQQLTDLNRWKQVQTQGEEHRTHFYLPLRWNQCRELFVYRLAEAFGWSEEQKETALNVVLAAESSR